MKSQKKSTFICAHHSIHDTKLQTLLEKTPCVAGYFHGHLHSWIETRTKKGLYCISIPSTGQWGDIGYALFRTFPDRAELTFRQTDFYFNRRWKGKPCPRNWEERVKRHDGRKVTFWYDKPGNFYKG